MQTLQSSPQMFLSQYGDYHENNHIQSMKRSSKSVSKYLQSSEMLYSPNKKFIDETIKNINTIKTKQEQSNWKLNQNHQQGGNNIDETKSNKRSHLAKDNVHQQSGNNLGKVVSKLETRLDGVEVKIASLTNVIKLLQKYSQTKDDQYEKQKQNLFYTKNTQQRVQQIDNIEVQNKLKQFNALSKQMKRQIEQVMEFKHTFETILPKISQISHLNVENKRPPVNPNSNNINRSKKSQSKSPTSQGSYLDVQDLATALQEMQQRLRDQINKKMEICLRQIKKISVNNDAQSITGIDQNLFEEQINALNFNINKLQNQCARNKMIMENQLQQLMNRLPTYYTPNLEYMSRKYTNQPDPIKIKAVRDRSAQKSTKRSRSRKKSQQRSVSRQNNREKSKSNLKSNNQSQKLLDKKKMKEEQLQQAIRRKKQIKEKLKNSHNIKNFS